MIYHQETVDRFRLYYNRNRFRRYNQHLHQGYCLTQFRALCRGANQRMQETVEYPLIISANSEPFLRLLRCYYTFFSVRSAFIVLVPTISETKQRRILIGTELFQSASWYIETTFMFWSMITALFLKFTLTPYFLDYKFMALYRMSETNSRYCQPADLGKYICFDIFLKFSFTLAKV